MQEVKSNRKLTGYERVRFAIVEQAIIDYKKALKREQRGKPPTLNYNVKGIEKWFLSDWGQFLSGGNGQYIIEHCRKLVKTKQKKYKKR